MWRSGAFEHLQILDTFQERDALRSQADELRTARETDLAQMSSMGQARSTLFLAEIFLDISGEGLQVTT